VTAAPASVTAKAAVISVAYHTMPGPPPITIIREYYSKALRAMRQA
jgi:hypothetical protein